MPKFFYSATFDESIEITRDLCKSGFRIIPDRTYDGPLAPEYDHVTDDLVELLREGPGFFLAGAFSRFPVQLFRLGGGPAEGKYVVDMFAHGPLLQGLLARLNVVDGEPTLLLGDLIYQSMYKHPEKGTLENPSPEVKGAYKFALSVMKKRLVKHELAEYHIGPEALSLAQAGKARLREYFPGPKSK
jgi:hypothetical protein